MRGFSLIELMIALAIVSVLAIFAFSSYQDTIKGGYMETAKGDMQAVATALEKWRSSTMTYAGFDIAASGLDNSPSSSTDVRYTLAVVTASNSYTVTATAVTGQQGGECNASGSIASSDVLTLNERGQGSPASCW